MEPQFRERHSTLQIPESRRTVMLGTEGSWIQSDPVSGPYEIEFFDHTRFVDLYVDYCHHP